MLPFSDGKLLKAIATKAIVFFAFLLFVPPRLSFAYPEYYKALKFVYPNLKLEGCNICHKDEKSGSLNPYGEDILNVARKIKKDSATGFQGIKIPLSFIPQAIKALEMLDSDLDNYPNLEELILNSNPGKNNDFPAESLFHGSFRYVHPLSSPRYIYDATLLRDNRVLITGGASPGFEVLNSAEIFDPERNTITPTGPMHYPRWSHTATLLPDGRVLVCGGRTGAKYDSVVLKECEIYDPKTGKFYLTDSMSVPRRSHTATLLKDGKVLITGGGTGAATFDLSDATDNCEIYDPKKSKFFETSPMHFPRQYHRATLLDDGRVLITGGSSKGTLDPSKEAEIYDPKIAKFTKISPMHRERIIHADVLLPDGRVLLAGGLDPITYEARADAELYDPKINRFLPIGSMHLKRIDIHGVLLDDGKVLIIGGSSLPFGPSDKPYFNPSCEIYDPKSGSFSFTASMHVARDAVMPVKLSDGRVFVCGGMTSSSFEFTQLAEVYIPVPKLKPTKKPEAIVQVSKKGGETPLEVEFHGSSNDTNEKIIAYLWDFGDGEQRIGRDVKYSYTCPGTYKGKLIVFNEGGEIGVTEFEINATGEKKEVSYKCDIKPIIDRRCLGCHGTRGGLTLATYKDMMRGGKKGKVIVPGDSKKSSLIESLEKGRMAVLSAVTPKEIEIIKRWIDEGAKDN